jgi:DNA-binding transcriptional ArsR family regulator
VEHDPEGLKGARVGRSHRSERTDRREARSQGVRKRLICGVLCSGSLSAVSKIANTPDGKILEALGDPINRVIAEKLLVVDSASPGEIAAAVRQRFPVSRSTVSTHITQLEDRLVVRRTVAGRVAITDRLNTERILQSARSIGAAALAEQSAEMKADHALLSRRLNKHDPTRQPSTGPPVGNLPRDDLATSTSN